MAASVSSSNRPLRFTFLMAFFVSALHSSLSPSRLFAPPNLLAGLPAPPWKRTAKMWRLTQQDFNYALSMVTYASIQKGQVNYFLSSPSETLSVGVLTNLPMRPNRAWWRNIRRPVISSINKNWQSMREKKIYKLLCG